MMDVKARSGASAGQRASATVVESQISTIVGGIQERTVNPDFAHSIPAGSDKLSSTGTRGFPDVFRINSDASSSGAQSVFKQRLLAAKAKRQTERPVRAEDTVSAQWLAGAGAAIGLDPTDVAALDAGNASRVVDMSLDERQDALQEVRSLLSDEVLRKWMAKKAAAGARAGVQAAGTATTAVEASLLASTPTPPMPRAPMDLSHITSEEQLDEAAAQLLPQSERAKLAWTGLFDAEGQVASVDYPSGQGLGAGEQAEDELAAYSWTAASAVQGVGAGHASAAHLEESDSDAMDSQMIRMMAAAGTAQLFTLWARAAAQAAAAEDDNDDEEDAEVGEDGQMLVPPRKSAVKIPAPEPLTTDTPMAHWASLRDTLGLSDEQVIDSSAVGVRLRIHPSGRRLRFDLSGRLIRAGWTDGGNQQEATALAIAAGLHHHGQDEDQAGYCLIEMLGLARSSAQAQRAIAMTMLAGVLESRHAAFVGRQVFSGNTVGLPPWRYGPDQWPEESRLLRSLLLPPALPILLALALRDTSTAVVRPALAAMRSFMCGNMQEERLVSDAVSVPLIRAQPPIDEEGDAGRLVEGQGVQQVTQAILDGSGTRAAHREPAPVQALRTGRAALVDPCAVLCRGQYGLLQQTARVLQGLVGDSGAVQQAALPDLLECLRILKVCASRSPSIAACISRSLTISLAVPGRTQRVSVGLLPWILHASLLVQGDSLRAGTASADGVRVASAALNLLLCIIRQGSSFARELCDHAGRGGGLGKGNASTASGGTAVSPVYLDALLQFAPLADSRVPVPIQCLLLDILACCLAYGLGMDRVSTLWAPHLQAVLKEGGQEGPIYEKVHGIVRLFCRQASRVAHLSALSLADERSVGHTASLLQRAVDAVSLCREARVMANAALSRPGRDNEDVQSDTLVFSLLSSYVSIDHPQQVGLQGGEEQVLAGPADSVGSVKLPLLHDVLLRAGGKLALVRSILQSVVLPAVESGSFRLHAQSAMQTGDEACAGWLTAFARLITQLHALDADIIEHALQEVKAFCLDVTAGLAMRAETIRTVHDGGQERQTGVVGRQAMPSTYWLYCQPDHPVACRVYALAHASAAMLTLSHRLHGPVPSLLCPAVHVLHVSPPDGLGIATAVACITHVLLAPGCLQKQGNAADMLGMKGGLLPLWYSTLCRVPLSPYTLGTDLQSWPRPAQAAWHRAAILQPGLLLPPIGAGHGQEEEYRLESLSPWIPSVPLWSTLDAQDAQDHAGQGGAIEPQEGGEEHSEGVAALCTGLPRPLRIPPGAPSSMARLVRSAVCCPLFILGCLDKLRSGTSGSAIHAGQTQAQVDHQEKEVILRPLRAVLQWMQVVGVHSLFSPPSPRAISDASQPAVLTSEEHALMLAHTALEAALLLFALLHVPLADVDAETGRSLCVALVEVYGLFKQCSPGAYPMGILCGHPTIGVHVLQALTQGLVETLAQEGPGSAGGALDVATLILLTPSSSHAAYHPQHVGTSIAALPSQQTALRPFVWKVLGESGVGHMVGEVVLDSIPSASLSVLVADLLGGTTLNGTGISTGQEEEEIHAITAFLGLDMTAHAAGNGKLPGPWRKVQGSSLVQRKAQLGVPAAQASVTDGERKDEQAGMQYSVPSAYQLAVHAIGVELWAHDQRSGQKRWASMGLEQLHSVVRTHVLQVDVTQP